MTDKEHRNQMQEHILASMKRIKARCYAIDHQTETSLTALAVAWMERRSDAGQKFSADALDQFLTDNIAPFVSGFVQRLPSAPPPKPEPWRDEITGEGAKNPWLTNDLESQGLITERDPILAGHLQRIAKDGGVSYAYLAELRDAEAKRQQIAAIRYGSDEHDANPFRKSDPRLQGEFVRNNPPEVVEFYRAESRPLRLPFSPASKNLTAVGAITAHDPTTGRIVSRAEQLERTWIESEVADARQAEQAAALKRKQVEELLAK